MPQIPTDLPDIRVAQVLGGLPNPLWEVPPNLRVLLQTVYINYSAAPGGVDRTIRLQINAFGLAPILQTSNLRPIPPGATIHNFLRAGYNQSLVSSGSQGLTGLGTECILIETGTIYFVVSNPDLLNDVCITYITYQAWVL